LVLRRRILPSWQAAYEDPPTRSIVITAGVWLVLGFMGVINMDNFAHLGGLVVGGALTWLLTMRPASRSAWALFALGFVALVLVALRPGWPSTSAQARDLFEMAALYYEGKPFGHDDQRAAKFSRRACAAGNQDACGLFGFLEYRGRGVPADHAAGLARINAACRQGSRSSCSMLQQDDGI
jgi:hypothetical protein